MHPTLIALGLGIALAGNAIAQTSIPSNPTCDAIPAPVPLQLKDRRLRETPDLSPRLQQLNVMANDTRCFEYAQYRMAEYAQAHPDDLGLHFVRARLTWSMGGIDQAIDYLKAVLREHPDFASGHVLQGAMYLQRGNLQPAGDHLKQALMQSPDDLWAKLNWWKLQAGQEDAEAKALLLQVAESREASRFARSASIEALSLRMPAEAPERERLMRLKIEVTEGHYREQAMIELASLLVYLERHAEARDLLKQLESARSIDPAAIKALHAQSLLREASRIAPRTTPDNQALVTEARNLVNGDFSQLAAMVAHDAALSLRLKPFLSDGKPIDPNAQDAYGMTPLCAAVMQGEGFEVRELVRQGGDPNLLCGKMSALAHAVLANTTELNTRLAIVGFLLENGADPARAVAPGLASLESHCHTYPECREQVWPKVQGYQSQSGRVR